jgi:hypothetical protein
MQIQNLPDTNLTDALTLPLYIGGTVGGQPLSSTFTLKWKFDGQLPSGWHIMLMDDATSETDSLTGTGSLTFQYDTPTDLIPSSSSFLQKNSSTASNQNSLLTLQRPAVFSVPKAKLAKTSTSASRFRIVISTNSDLSGYMPTTPELAQNYPNPFNPTTTISFTVPSKSYVSIQIYNILGKKIATLTDQEYPAGRHAIVWDASTVASGVYYCRMVVGDWRKTIKTLVLK